MNRRNHEAGATTVRLVMVLLIFASPIPSGAQEASSIRSLAGTWQFYPHAFVGSQADPVGDVPIEVPSDWAAGGQERFGWGTYRRVIHHDGSPAPMALRLDFVATAYRLYVNGEYLGGVGEPGADRASHRPQWYPALYTDLPAREEGGRRVFDIRLEVANWEHLFGGLRSPVYFGTTADLQKRETNWRTRDWIFMGAALLMAVYHLAIYLMHRKEPYVLWFGLLALAYAVRAGFNNAVFWNGLFPSIPWIFMFRLEYLAIVGIEVFLLLYTASVFRIRPSRPLAAAVLLPLAAATVIALLAPPAVMAGANLAAQALVVVAVLALTVRIAILARKGHRDALWFVVGLILAGLTVIVDSLFFAGAIPVRYTGDAAGVLFLLAQSILVARRFSNALRDQEHLALALTEVNARLEDSLREDVVTGLPNRRALAEAVESEMARSERSDHVFALLFVDLDNFKHVNDSLGHHAGDDLLRLVVSRLTRVMRRTDTMFRVGGDEFVILAVELGDRADASRLAASVVTALGHTFGLSGREILIGASVGISSYPLDGRNLQSLLQSADAAMYSAKRSGKGTFRLYEESMSQASGEQMLLGGRLARAVQAGELSLVYQPQVSARTGELVSVEALLRWNDPDLGTIPPARFLPIAEDSGLISQVGRFVLTESLAALGHLDGTLGRQVRMSVNISATRFDDSAFVDEVESIVAASGIAPARVCLEITEHTIGRRWSRALEALEALRARGFEISIDDFGQGYSSLNHIRAIPATELKIDRGFVTGIDRSAKDAALVKWIVALGVDLGLRVVAEGVETEGQRAALAEAGVDLLQGYLFGRPVPAAEVGVVSVDA